MEMGNVKEKQKVVLLVGIIGSGKSTLARQIAEKNPQAVIVVGDSFRSMLKPSYIYREDIEQIIKNLTETAILSAVQHNLDPVIDEADGYITKEKRMELIKLIRNFFPDKEEVQIIAIEFSRGSWCLERRLQDDRGLSPETWERVYKEMSRDFEPVTEDEGFDVIQYHNAEPQTRNNVSDPTEQQRMYCRENKVPYLIPMNGHCFRCKADIRFHPVIVRSAKTSQITTCPSCGMAWGD